MILPTECAALNGRVFRVYGKCIVMIENLQLKLKITKILIGSFVVPIFSLSTFI